AAFRPGFFFQAEDGIRDFHVTGVQTCALPICALFGAAGFEALKQIAAVLVARVTENPVYGTFAVLVGLMVWINIASRFMLFVAAWTATRRVVLTADAAAEENVADPETVARPGEPAEPEETGSPETKDEEDGEARDRKAQDQKASSAY